ncbi:Coenzyme F420 hydrogenase/dehydrogenase, beta subunit C-terminal domain [Chloroflexota bacterium]
MARDVFLEVSEDGLLETLKRFWRGLLEKGLVDALLIPVELPSGYNVVPTLVTDADSLEAANPLAPVLPVNSARIVSDMTKVAPSQKKIGVVLRPCELRAVIELAKLNQVSLENLILIGIDCFGTYSLNNYAKLVEEGQSPTQQALDLVREGKDDPLLREACQVCEYPFPMNADLTIALIGSDLDKNIFLQAATEKGERILEALELKEGDGSAERQSAITKLVSERVRKRDELFEQTVEQVHGLDNLLSAFARCINCHNCRDVCPICYCKECLFDSPTFEWEADKYLDWASKKNMLRMPTDTLLFHLTRLNHMAISCVGCGLCQEACPNEIPVFRIFRLVGARVQKVFDYLPGRSLEEELPLVTFEESELQEVGYE